MLLWYFLSLSAHPFVLALKDRTLARIPVLNTVRNKIAVHQFIRILSLLLLRKIPEEEALSLAANSMDSQYIAQALKRERPSNNDGFLDRLRTIDLMPKHYIKLIDIAQRTQTMDEALREAVDTHGNAMVDEMLLYQDKIELLYKLGIGFVFALIATSVYLPIFKMGAIS